MGRSILAGQLILLGADSNVAHPTHRFGYCLPVRRLARPRSWVMLLGHARRYGMQMMPQPPSRPRNLDCPPGHARVLGGRCTRMSVAIRLRDADEALRAAEMADTGWASGEPWLYGVWALIRIGAGTAYVMKGDLDSAGGQINAVVTLAPAFRIATITSYLADLDTLLGQRRFAGNNSARELREQIAAFTAAASPATSAAREGM
jgi:hypothetical protein